MTNSAITTKINAFKLLESEYGQIDKNLKTFITAGLPDHIYRVADDNLYTYMVNSYFPKEFKPSYLNYLSTT